MRPCVFALSAFALLAACSKPQTASQPPASDQEAAVAAASDQAATASDIQAQAALPSVATAPSPIAGPDFVAMAAAGDMFEIRSARIAEKRSMNPKVIAFAKMMIVDHTKTTARLKKAIAESGEASDLPLPKTLPDKQKAMIDALNAAPDDAFDKLYIQQQIDAHQDALNLMTGYADHGHEPALKAAAKVILPVVQMHLDRIKHIQTELGKD